MDVRWLEERRRGIGGSDVAAILGLSPWKTAYQVYLEKRNEAKPWEGNAATDWGQRQEPIIRQWYSDVTGRAVRLPDKIMYNERHPFMLASLDGFTDDGRVVEIKTARSGRDWGEPGSDQIPEHYLLQVQHYLVVTGFPVCDVPVSIAGNSPALYEVLEDKELQGLLIEAEADFWDRVQEGRPPDVVTYADAVRRFGRGTAQGAVTATSEMEQAVLSLRSIKTDIARLEADEEALKGKIIAAIGEAGDALVGVDGKALVTYKLAAGRTTFDAKAFERDHGELYKQYIKTAEAARRFLLK